MLVLLLKLCLLKIIPRLEIGQRSNPLDYFLCGTLMIVDVNQT